MVLKRIFPTKDKDEDRQKQAVAKMLFLSIVGLSILAAYLVVDTSSSTKKENPQTLGEETVARAKEQDEALAKNIAEGVGTVKDTAEYLQSEIEVTTQNAVLEGKKKVEEVTNEILYSKAIKPIVDKIEDLPPSQQELLRKQICPIVDTP